MEKIFTIIADKKVIAAVFFLIMVILGGLFWHFDNKVTLQTLENLNDQLSLTLNNQLERERDSALQNALIISQNTELIDALEEEDEDKGFKILSEGMEAIKLHTDSLIRAQIITSEYVIFARSWDNSYAGMPLDFHRPDLLYFQKHRKPRSAIEVGRKLGVKATVPVYHDIKMIGFVEVVTFFEMTQEYFERLGIDMYILMDERFYNTAVFMQANPAIGKEYILANTKYTKQDIALLESVDYKKIRQGHVLYTKGKYLFYEPMLNGEGETIGAFIFSLTPKQVDTYANSGEDNLSFLIRLSRSDLYDIMAKKSLDNVVFQSSYDKELLYLKDTVPAEDKELFLAEARERLNAYSKEELIAMMLNYKVTREIKGEIR